MMRFFPLLTLLACMPDDVTDSGAPYTESDADADADADTDTDTDTEQDLTGAWVSTGADLSPLFAEAGFTRIVANFEASGAYDVEAFYSAGSITLTGTYSVDLSTAPAGIVLQQGTPTVAEAEGIWQIEPDGALMYEVTQTDPNPDGYTAPTPAGGFGSTVGPGLSPGDNVQIYRRP